MKELIKLLLSTLGLDAATIEKVLDDEKAKGLKASDIASSIQEKAKDNAINVLKNEGYVKKDDVEKEIEGKLYGTFRRDIKKRFPKLDLSDSEMKEKKPHELLDLAVKSVEADDNSAIKQLQDKNIELENKITKLEQEELPAAKKQAQLEIAREKANNKIRDLLLKKKESKSLIPSVDGAFNALGAIYEKNYDIRIAENGDLEFFKKGTETRVQGKVDGVEKIMSAEEIVTNDLKTFDFIKESNGGGGAGSGGAGGGGTHTVEIQPDKLKKLPGTAKRGVSEAQKRLDEMSAKAQA